MKNVTTSTKIRIDGTLPKDAFYVLPEWAASLTAKKEAKKLHPRGKKRDTI